MDAEDIKKLDKHIVEPILEGLEGLSEELGARMGRLEKRMESSERTNKEGFARSHAIMQKMVENSATNSGYLRGILGEMREVNARLKRVDEHEGRIKRLEERVFGNGNGSSKR